MKKKTKNHKKLKIKENHKKIKVQAEKENDQLGSNSIKENKKEKKKLENRKKVQVTSRVQWLHAENVVSVMKVEVGFSVINTNFGTTLAAQI